MQVSCSVPIGLRATIGYFPGRTALPGSDPIRLGTGNPLCVVLSFMMGVTTLSLPSMIMLRKAVKPVDGIHCIKVLGAGCMSCHELYEMAKEAVKKLDLAIEVEYITDMEKIMTYGVMRIPALVVNEQVISMGKILTVREIEKLLRG